MDFGQIGQLPPTYLRCCHCHIVMDTLISNFVFDFDEKINSVASKQWPLQKEFMAGDINYTHIIVKNIINK